MSGIIQESSSVLELPPTPALYFFTSTGFLEKILALNTERYPDTATTLFFGPFGIGKTTIIENTIKEILQYVGLEPMNFENISVSGGNGSLEELLGKIDNKVSILPFYIPVKGSEISLDTIVSKPYTVEFFGGKFVEFLPRAKFFFSLLKKIVRKVKRKIKKEKSDETKVEYIFMPVIFIDEFTSIPDQAARSILYEFIRTGRLAGRKGYPIVFLAANPNDISPDADILPPGLANRMRLIYLDAQSIDEFNDYIQAKNSPGNSSNRSLETKVSALFLKVIYDLIKRFYRDIISRTEKYFAIEGKTVYVYRNDFEKASSGGILSVVFSMENLEKIGFGSIDNALSFWKLMLDSPRIYIERDSVIERINNHLPKLGKPDATLKELLIFRSKYSPYGIITLPTFLSRLAKIGNINKFQKTANPNEPFLTARSFEALINYLGVLNFFGAVLERIVDQYKRQNNISEEEFVKEGIDDLLEWAKEQDFSKLFNNLEDLVSFSTKVSNSLSGFYYLMKFLFGKDAEKFAQAIFYAHGGNLGLKLYSLVRYPLPNLDLLLGDNEDMEMFKTELQKILSGVKNEEKIVYLQFVSSNLGATLIDYYYKNVFLKMDREKRNWSTIIESYADFIVTVALRTITNYKKVLEDIGFGEIKEIISPAIRSIFDPGLYYYFGIDRMRMESALKFMFSNVSSPDPNLKPLREKNEDEKLGIYFPWHKKEKVRKYWENKRFKYEDVKSMLVDMLKLISVKIEKIGEQGYEKA